MPDSKGEYIVGVDVGGTKILAGLFDNSYECIGTEGPSAQQALMQRYAQPSP